MRNVLIIFFGLFFLACTSTNSDTLKIACASNLEVGMDSIIKAFEAENDIDCELIVGASGILSTQIIEGAPYDIFISANESYADRVSWERTSDSPEFLTSTQMVMVNLSGLEYSNYDSLLLDERITKIGIADPEFAPYGTAAKEYLQNKDLWESIEEKLVFAESLAHLNGYITSKAVDVAFTSKTFVHQSKSNYDFIVLDSDMKTGHYTPIHHFYVRLISSSKSSDGAKKFARFLKSEESSKILEYFGYD